MSSLACVAAEVNESTGSAFLIAFQQHAAAMGSFRPIADRLRVKMKAVRYSVLQKGQTLVASILLGCPYTSSINHRLVPDSVAAREWGMERFPDQSQVNLFLNRMTAENMAQLEQAHQELLHSHSLLRSAAQVVVDLDQTGVAGDRQEVRACRDGLFPPPARCPWLPALSCSGQCSRLRAGGNRVLPGSWQRHRSDSAA